MSILVVADDERIPPPALHCGRAAEYCHPQEAFQEGGAKKTSIHRHTFLGVRRFGSYSQAKSFFQAKGPLRIFWILARLSFVEEFSLTRRFLFHN